MSTVFAGQAAGIKEVEEGIWLVSSMDYDLVYIDLEELEEKTLQPLDNPFWPKAVIRMAHTFCYLCVWIEPVIFIICAVV